MFRFRHDFEFQTFGLRLNYTISFPGRLVFRWQMEGFLCLHTCASQFPGRAPLIYIYVHPIGSLSVETLTYTPLDLSLAPAPYNFINLFRLFQLSSWHSLSTCLGLHPLELQASVHSLGLFCWLILDLDAHHGPGSGELLRGLFYLVGSHWGHFVLLRVSFS